MIGSLAPGIGAGMLDGTANKQLSNKAKVVSDNMDQEMIIEKQARDFSKDKIWGG